MATSPKKGVKHVRLTRIGANLGAIRYPNTLRVDTDCGYPHQSSADADRPVQKIERNGRRQRAALIEKKMKEKLLKITN